MANRLELHSLIKKLKFYIYTQSILYEIHRYKEFKQLLKTLQNKNNAVNTKLYSQTILEKSNIV